MLISLAFQKHLISNRIIDNEIYIHSVSHKYFSHLTLTSKLNLWVSWAVPGVSAMAQLDCWRWDLKLNMEIIITNHISPRPLSTVVSLLASEISTSTSSHQFTILHAYCRGDPLYSYRWKLHNRVFYSIHKVTFCFSFNVLTWFLLRHRNAISSRCRVYLPSLSISRPPSVSPHQARRLYARAAPC